MLFGKDSQVLVHNLHQEMSALSDIAMRTEMKQKQALKCSYHLWDCQREPYNPIHNKPDQVCLWEGSQIIDSPCSTAPNLIPISKM